MGQVLHGSATTTEAVRRAIQDSQESLRVLARRYGINPKTVAKWKKRKSVKDRPTVPKAPRRASCRRLTTDRRSIPRGLVQRPLGFSQSAEEAAGPGARLR